jgi:hypothetical protein
MVDQRVAAEKQNGVGTPYIPPMTRRLKCRIDPEQSPYTCMLPEHKPVRRGREMIDLLAVEEPKPKPAKIRAVSYEAAIDQLFKRMRSSSSALTQQASEKHAGAMYELMREFAALEPQPPGCSRQPGGHGWIWRIPQRFCRCSQKGTPVLLLLLRVSSQSNSEAVLNQEAAAIVR